MRALTAMLAASCATGTPDRSVGAVNEAEGLVLSVSGPGYLRLADADGTISYAKEVSVTVQPGANLRTPEGAFLTPRSFCPADLKGLSISQDGTVSGRRADGQEAWFGQIVLYQFSRPEGLESTPEGHFVESPESGAPLMRMPADPGAGFVQSVTVEVQ